MIEGINPSEHIGYMAGQEIAHLNPYLQGTQLRWVALHSLQQASQLLRLNESQYLLGFRTGYRDELAGLAHPLPKEGGRHDNHRQ